MAFCQNCGKELEKGAKFCTGCGKPIVAAEEDGSKRTIKFKDADIIKCPNCGQDGLSRFDTVCPTCGFKFEAKERSKGVDELRALISDCDGDLKKQLDVVRNFTCPNNAQDMYELIVFSANQISTLKQIENGSARATQSVYEEVYSRLFKASPDTAVIDCRNLQAAYLGIIKSIRGKLYVMFGGTDEGKRIYEMTAEIQRKAEKEVHKMSKAKKKKLVGGVIAISIWILLCFGSIGLYYYLMPLHEKDVTEEQTRLETLASEIQADIDAGKTVDAELKLQSLEWTYTVGMGAVEDENSSFSRKHREWEGKRQVLRDQLDKAAKTNNK